MIIKVAQKLFYKAVKCLETFLTFVIKVNFLPYTSLLSDYGRGEDTLSFGTFHFNLLVSLIQYYLAPSFTPTLQSPPDFLISLSLAGHYILDILVAFSMYTHCADLVTAQVNINICGLIRKLLGFHAYGYQIISVGFQSCMHAMRIINLELIND